MIKFAHQLVDAKPFHHFIVAGLETSPALMAQHGAATLEDELRSHEQELKEMQTRIVGLRRQWSGEARRSGRARDLQEIAS